MAKDIKTCELSFSSILWFQKTFIPPTWKGSDFPWGMGGGGGQFLQFSTGVNHREIFSVDSHDVYESYKKKTKIYYNSVFAKISNMIN